MRSLVLCLCLALVVPHASAVASEAEYQRLKTELDKLATRNHWKGVDRFYRKLEKLGWPLAPSDHLLGAQAAKQRGDMLMSLDRLESAIASQPADSAAQLQAQQRARAELDAVLSRYGKVELVVGDLRVAALVRFEMPFAPDEQEAIRQAQKQLGKERAFQGLLPLGEYMIDGERFEIVNSSMWQAFRIE